MDSLAETHRRQIDIKDGADCIIAHLDAPAVALDDLLADGQTDAGSGVFRPGMESLENDKNPARILWGDADALVGHGDLDDVDRLAAARTELEQAIERWAALESQAG